MTRYACLSWNLKVLSHAFILLSTVGAEPPATSFPLSTRIGSTPTPRAHTTTHPPLQATSTAGNSLSTETCRYFSINHITNRLPQQCWAGSISTPATDGYAAASSALDALSVTSIELLANPAQTDASKPGSVFLPSDKNVADQLGDTLPASAGGSTPSSTAVEVDSHPQIELEAESPLDNAKFLSFEDWKQQKLESGEGPAALPNERKTFSQDRQRPGFNNALDALGDDSEIAFDFNPFGASNNQLDQPTEPAQTTSTVTASSGAASRAPDTPHKRSKDAGKTCKERSNFASFDCAANVLKTNPKCKSSSSILVENKDSYMLNECSMDNKFLIVELCENVLIDTVVLANFEFFSSIFRTFRISGSVHYPPKPDQWKHVGTFEARNSREIQSFLVEPPKYARYLRVEFLTHYGSEYYCPVSLLRVHGMSMYEEFLEETQPPDESGPDTNPDTVTVISEIKEDRTISLENLGVDSESTATMPTPAGQFISESPSSTAPADVCLSTADPKPKNIRFATPEKCAVDAAPTTSMSSQDELASKKPTSTVNVQVSSSKPADDVTAPTAEEPHATQTAVIRSFISTTNTVSNANETASKKVDNQPTQIPDSPPTTFTATVQHLQPAPPPYQPPTQESFFKSMHKRLQALEANASLSLQYIESQSALLRDAFAKVEKRQLAKTSTFLDTLNITVTTELARFKSQYDQLWQSAVMELASQREDGRREREQLGERIKLLAEEMVNQKRLMAAQATLLLLCLGLVIFGKLGHVSPSLDSGLIQGMQEIVMKAKEARLHEAETGEKSWQRGDSPSKRAKKSPRSREREVNGLNGGGLGKSRSAGALNEAGADAEMLSVRSAPTTPGK